MYLGTRDSRTNRFLVNPLGRVRSDLDPGIGGESSSRPVVVVPVVGRGQLVRVEMKTFRPEPGRHPLPLRFGSRTGRGGDGGTRTQTQEGERQSG